MQLLDGVGDEVVVQLGQGLVVDLMLVALIGGGIFVAVSYVTQLVHPGGVFEDSASAAGAIALQIGGELLGAVFLAGLVVAQFAVPQDRPFRRAGLRGVRVHQTGRGP